MISPFFEYVVICRLALLVGNMPIEMFDQLLVAKILQDEMIEGVTRYTGTFQKAHRKRAISDEFALRTGVLGPNFVGEPAQPGIASDRFAAAAGRRLGEVRCGRKHIW